MISKNQGTTRTDVTEIFAVQQNIITLQSDVINKLFLQLMQYVTAEEVENLDCIADINKAAKLRATLGEL